MRKHTWKMFNKQNDRLHEVGVYIYRYNLMYAILASRLLTLIVSMSLSTDAE